MNRTSAVLCLVLSGFVSLFAQPENHVAQRVSQSALPIMFEPGAGQGSEMVGRSPEMTLEFAPGRVRIALQSGGLEIAFIGARAAVPHGEDLQKSQTNYLVGDDPAQWHTHVPNFGKVIYSGLYPGIDAVFYGSRQRIEHDFIVSPGADYRQIRLHLSHEARASLDKDGTLTIALKDGALQMQKPVIYQEIGGKRVERNGSFRLLANGDLGFDVTSYDRRHALIIDPVLSFATYLSPSGENASLIATDAAGDNYVAGYGSLGYPVTTGAFSGCPGCTANYVVTFVSKLNPDGTSLIYSTVLGGNSFAQPTGIAVDPNGNAIVSGWTGATNFPTKSGQLIATQNNNYVGFLASLSADGSSLNYGTLLGSSPSSGMSTMTYATAVAVDSTGNAYVTGETGNGFPTTSGALNQGGGGSFGNQFNVYVAKFSPTGGLLYSAVIGAADPQNGGAGPIGASAIAIDAAGDAFVAGQAGILWPISSNAYLKQIAGSIPYATPFVTEVAPDAKSLIYSTYLDYAYVVAGLAVLPNGNALVVGNGAEPNYPTSANAYQKGSSSGGEPFLAEVNTDGSGLAYSTLVGDSSTWLYGLALDAINRNIWLTGETHNSGFPLITPLQSTFPASATGLPGPASLVYQFDPTGETLEFSTFLGSVAGYGNGIAIDASHRAHVSGAAQYGMYTSPGVYDPSVPVPGQGYSSSTYAYVALIDPTVPAAAVCVNPNTSLYFSNVAAGTSADQSETVTSCGTEPLSITGITAGASVFTIPTSKDGCTQQIPVGQSCTFDVRYSPTGAESDSSTLRIQSNASIPVAVIGVEGNGVVPKIAVNGSPIFAYTVVGQTSPPALLFVSDAGGAPLQLNASGTSASGDFSIQGLGGCASPTSSNCVLNVYFTPSASGTRTGTLTIASNDPANPVITVPLQAVGYAAAPVPQITTLSSELIPAGLAEANFFVQGFGFLPSSVVQVNGVAQPTAYGDSNELTATLSASSIPANSYGELSVTVFTPGPGGGTSEPYKVTLFQQVSGTNAFLLDEPVSGRLFVSTPASDANHPNTVIPINPTTAAAGTPIAVGNDPRVLAASADGKYLYVALNGDHAIQRINLSTEAIEKTFPLPVDAEFGNLNVYDMHVVPGNDTEVVASLMMPTVDPSEDGIALFNDSGLVNWLPSMSQGSPVTPIPIDRFSFTNDPTTLYGVETDQPGLTEVGVSATGLTALGKSCCSQTTGLANAGTDVVSDGTYLYTDAGLVWDPTKTQPVASYPVPSEPYLDVVPDSATGKTYFLNQFGKYGEFQATTVLAFDRSTLAETGSRSLTQTTAATNLWGTQLVRWGSNGFAFRAGPLSAPTTSVILFTSSSLTTVPSQNPTPVVSSLNPASAVSGGADFQLTVKGSDFVSGSTVTWNGAPRLTTFVSSSQLTATIYASDIAVAGTGQVAVANPGPGGGNSANVSFTISSPASAITLNPATLTFTAQAVGTSSAAQTITLNNTGTATLSGLAFSITGTNAGSFAEANNCGTSITAGASCAINVTFTPAAAGTASAAITITDNSPTSPQSVTLSGSAPQIPFTIGTGSGGNTSNTVTAGQSASYALSITPAQGYYGTVSFSCSSLPANASCSFNPSSLKITGNTAANVTVTIATQSQTSALLSSGRIGSVLACVLMVLPFASKHRRARFSGLALVALLLVVAGLSACGGGPSGSGGGSGTGSGSGSAMVAPGTYTVQLTVSDGKNSQTQPLTLVVQ